MKIDINLDSLWASVNRMGAEYLSLDLGVVCTMLISSLTTS